MRKWGWAVLAAALCVTAGEGRADDAARLISTHGLWKVHSFMDGGQKVCFISGQPLRQEGKYKKRDTVQFFVTRWSDDADNNVVSISAGYPYRPQSQATVRIDGQSFKLLTQGEMAWSRNQDMDNTITDALQKSSLMVVEGVSARGTKTTDTYDLKDMPAAYKSFRAACAPPAPVKYQQ